MSRIGLHSIAEATLQLLASGKSQQEVARELAGYLIDERRTRELEALTRNIEVLRYKRDGVLEAEASSAHTLTDEIKQQITQQLDAKRVILDETYDQDIVGGVRVRALDKQLDLSVESKLNQLKHNVKVA
ncbi:MAG TPA: F0F1 ATP synthase subunit delta [Patescibacteria group bacterium]|nr:F0F1 ATP synthase subunit delta [Patescibacteria group bacterium]